MAKNQNAAETETKEAAPVAEAPGGFQLRSSVSDAPWVEQEENNVCMGRLINRFEMQNQTPRRWYYQVELSAPCKVREGKGDDAEVRMAKKGEIVNLNQNFKTAVLNDQEIPATLAGGAYDIWVKFGEKVKIGGGKTMWNITVRSKMVAPARNPIRALPSDVAGEGGAEDAPF